MDCVREPHAAVDSEYSKTAASRTVKIMSENKNTCHKWAEQNMSTMRNRVGECSKNQTLKKMQVNIPCRCMHEREMVMQSGERGNLAVLCC